jgi:hypothetical protein
MHHDQQLTDIDFIRQLRQQQLRQQQQQGNALDAVPYVPQQQGLRLSPLPTVASAIFPWGAVLQQPRSSGPPHGHQFLRLYDCAKYLITY